MNDENPTPEFMNNITAPQDIIARSYTLNPEDPALLVQFLARKTYGFTGRTRLELKLTVAPNDGRSLTKTIDGAASASQIIADEHEGGIRILLGKNYAVDEKLRIGVQPPLHPEEGLYVAHAKRLLDAIYQEVIDPFEKCAQAATFPGKLER